MAGGFGMTQRKRVLAILKAAGRHGVRSDIFIADHLPRAAARVGELKDEGYNITSEREGKWTRYTLVGLGAEGGQDTGKESSRVSPVVEGGAEPGENLELLPEKRSGMYDPFGQAA